MNFNATIIGQMIAFTVFVWFFMKKVWPPIIKAMEEREARIKEGLSASDEAEKNLIKSQEEGKELIEAAKLKAQGIIEQANRRGKEIIEEAKVKSKDEAEKILHAADAEIEKQALITREELRASLANLVILGAEKIVEKEIDSSLHQSMLDKLSQQL